MSAIREVAKLQSGYQKLFDGCFTKKKLCELCVPFRDKYKLTDRQTLMIARNELSLDEILDLVGEE